MSPVSHQVSNTLKRLVVIVSSILYFGNPTSWTNYLGIAIASFGFLCYSTARLQWEYNEVVDGVSPKNSFTKTKNNVSLPLTSISVVKKNKLSSFDAKRTSSVGQNISCAVASAVRDVRDVMVPIRFGKKYRISK